jgi:pSer/pThr/pTyr-binding forkhead associated (FHA) protein
LEDAESQGIELGEVPPDPDNLWLSWAEGRLRDAEASEELIAAGEDPEEEPVARPRIVFEEGTVQERVWVMEEGELTIGRARGNHVQIRDDRGVSRLHCTIFERDGAYFVRDNGSTKGTLVDGHLVVDDQPLETGTRVTLGDTEMVFRL